MVDRARVVLFGLGPMGLSIARFAITKKFIEVVGAVDIDPELVGKDIGDILNLGSETGVIVTNDVDSLLARIEADIAIHATVSDLRMAFPQLEKIIKAGINVVSTCEELSFPYIKYPELSKTLNILAERYGVTILGTGINPGYLMDTLPVTLTGICQEVEKVKVTRMMDSKKRRIPYQKKIGTGLGIEEFNRLIGKRIITGHVGLHQSISMIAAALKWDLDAIVEMPP